MCGQMLYVHDTLTLISRLARWITCHSIVDLPVLLERPLGRVVTHAYQALSGVCSQLVMAETYQQVRGADPLSNRDRGAQYSFAGIFYILHLPLPQ
jgi:hypothetical protein